MKNTTKLLIAAATLGLATSANAVIIFTEQNFTGASATNNADIPDGTTFSTTGTTASADVSDWTFNTSTPPAGNYLLADARGVAMMTGADNATVATGAVTLTLLANTVYTIDWLTSLNGNPGMAVDLAVTGDVTASQAGTVTVAPAATLSASQLVFTTGAAGTANLTFTANANGVDSTNADVWLERIEIDATPVPEPSSTALLGLGGLALIMRRRK